MDLAVVALRERIPVRSVVAQRANYRLYKGELRADFNARCGYCDSIDEYFGGLSSAHIDHFAPKSKFPELASHYCNLIYSCPFCNGAKSNKWLGVDAGIPNNGREGFVDPCNEEFDTHLARRASGEIVPTSRLGEYMVNHLKLRLMRHRFIWQAQRLDELMARLLELRPLVQGGNPLHLELLEAIADLLGAYQEYRRRIYAK